MKLQPSLSDITLANVTATVLQARNTAGHWEGKLSSSALSTATAIFALSTYARATALSAPVQSLIRRGVEWLCSNQNADGGWGDTVLSISNISTTALCWAALTVDEEGSRAAVAKAERWLAKAAGSLQPADLSRAIKARYGKDHTFSVPILTMCALAGRLGRGRSAWRWIPQLPFELAAFPYQWFQWLRLPVVSYALPALIAMGQVRHFHKPTRNPAARVARALARNRTLRLLKEIQPRGGGFLEATPLTSFVVMSLVGCGQSDHPVTMAGVDFLVRSVQGDGSWAIDTNLSTWVTTLSVNALASHPEFDRVLPAEDRSKIRDWLLGQQYRVEHLYTHAPPGAWAWTDLPGGVPDADDTAGALIALWNLSSHDDRVLEGVNAAVHWLLNIQNRDGGIPTFCRGWGNLPFDRSGSDLTAHALHAWALWRPRVCEEVQSRIDLATRRALAFLRKHQREDGSWIPLWFGNQYAPEEDNPTYGTSRVLTALCGLAADHASDPSVALMRHHAVGWLLDAQNPDGSWGGGVKTTASVEETSLAAHALVTCAKLLPPAEIEPILAAVRLAIEWLTARTAYGKEFRPSPIGFYFAKLWYFETSYAPLFCLATLAEQCRR